MRYIRVASLHRAGTALQFITVNGIEGTLFLRMLKSLLYLGSLIHVGSVTLTTIADFQNYGCEYLFALPYKQPSET